MCDPECDLVYDEETGEDVCDCSAALSAEVEEIIGQLDSLAKSRGESSCEKLGKSIDLSVEGLTEEECEAMIQIGYKYEYKRSEDVGEEKADGTFGSVQSSRRTSENAWCSSHTGCRAEELPERVHKRISMVLDIPPENR